MSDAHGRPLFANDAAGLEGALVSLGSLAPHATATWVDDQLPSAGAPAIVKARVGEAASAGGRLPVLAAGAVHLGEDPTSGVVATGSVTNRSKVAQQQLVLYGIARRGGRIVAAGRGVLGDLAGGASAPFQVSFVGDARGARVQISAPATTQG